MTEFPIAMGDIQPPSEKPADQYPSPHINLENAFIEIEGKRYKAADLLARLLRESKD